MCVVAFGKETAANKVHLVWKRAAIRRSEPLTLGQESHHISISVAPWVCTPGYSLVQSLLYLVIS